MATVSSAAHRYARMTADPRKHPVIQLLRQRRDERSRPETRQDNYRVGLAVEGGGLRGVVSGGMLTALSDLQLRESFDVIYGSSAGSFNAAYFLTNGVWEGLSIYYRYLATTKFFDPKRAFQRRPVVDLDWVVNEVMERDIPLDWSAVLLSPVKLNVIASSVKSLSTVLLSQFSSTSELKLALKAGALMPIVAGPPVHYRNDQLLDAGVLEAHPYQSAVNDECTHILSLSSRPLGFSLNRSVADRVLAARLEAIKTGLGTRYLQRFPDYTRARRELAQLSQHPSMPPYVFDIVAPANTSRVRRLSRDVRGILAGGSAGYDAAIEAIEGKTVKSFYRLTAPHMSPVYSIPSV